MKLWEIHPFEGVGSLKFGTERANIRRLLKEEFKSFKRAGEANATDYYQSLGLLLSYDNEDKLEFIELVEPCTPIFKGIEFLKTSITEILQALLDLGYIAKIDEAGYNLEELGIMLYVALVKLEAISLYKKGYYD